MHKKLDTLPDLCVSSLRRGHANLPCIVPINFIGCSPKGIHAAPPSSLLFAPLFPSHQCRVLPSGGKFVFQKHLFSYCCKDMRPPGVEPGAQAWEACMLPLFYRPHDTSQETRQWLLRIAPLPLFLLPLKQHSAAAKRPTARGFEPLRAELNGFLVHLLGHSDTLSCLFLPPTVHLHQPGIEPGSHRWQRCVLPLDH